MAPGITAVLSALTLFSGEKTAPSRLLPLGLGRETVGFARLGRQPVAVSHSLVPGNTDYRLGGVVPALILPITGLFPALTFLALPAGLGPIVAVLIAAVLDEAGELGISNGVAADSVGIQRHLMERPFILNPIAVRSQFSQFIQFVLWCAHQERTRGDHNHLRLKGELGLFCFGRLLRRASGQIDVLAYAGRANISEIGLRLVRGGAGQQGAQQAAPQELRQRTGADPLPL